MNFFKIFFASLLAIFISFVVIVFIFIGSLTALIIGSETTSTPKSNSVLVIDMGESIVDTPVSNPLKMVDFTTFTIRTQITTLDAIRAIEQASVDDNIKGIYLRSRMSGAHSLALLEELRTELSAFRESGKFIVAYGDGYSQGEYYLASVADSIYLQREGMIAWQGLSVSSIFYKGLLDKIDANVEVFRPTDCSYKSAIEPLTRTNMSDESREQNLALIESLWSTITSKVAESRQLTPSLLNMYADRLTSFIARDAKSARFVDELIYEDELEQRFESLGVEIGDDKRANRVSLSEYIATCNFNTPLAGSTKKVAVIYAEGTIVDGKGDVGEVGGDTMARILRKIRNDDDVKSVVLRVNSPGGSALAADVMWREVELLRQKKPVIVSMGEYAASGGYYISAPADVIIANDLTITGSIGVYGVLIDLEGSLSLNLGITFDSAKSNPSGDFMRLSRPITPTERAVMNRSVDQVYDTFTTHVSDGRNLSKSRVHEVAQGRVWSGLDGQNIGLVDGIGGIKTAILLAAERGGVVDNFEITQHSPLDDEWGGVFSALNFSLLTKQYNAIFKELRHLDSKGGLVMFSPLRVE